jgi:hypothetical protein
MKKDDGMEQFAIGFGVGIVVGLLAGALVGAAVIGTAMMRGWR